MEIARYLLIRFLTEVWGFKLDSESGGVLALRDGGNKVVVKTIFLDVYEEAALYKEISELAKYDYDKAFIAVLPSGLPLIDPKHLKSLGIGLISVDPSKGLDGVEMRLPAKPRDKPQAPGVDMARIISAVNAAVAEALNREAKKIEEELYERLRRYLDKAVEDLRRELAARPPIISPAQQQPQPSTPRQAVEENEWVKILRKKA
ncbi:MAG: hypothetical protein TU35_004100 [Thermoproteus sp. AZ2]|uniref:Uncharacterized protein n=1 Tax=Thermoproteus sp. AZ2 TaxID=1609232 RepID=A0ACC6V031_9CREN|nr:MAG: actin [Thermoproteus sp. AZ2]